MKFSVLIKLTILVENEGVSEYLRVKLGLENHKKCKFIKYATHCQHDYKVTGGLEWATQITDQGIINYS